MNELGKGLATLAVCLPVIAIGWHSPLLGFFSMIFVAAAATAIWTGEVP